MINVLYIITETKNYLKVNYINTVKFKSFFEMLLLGPTVRSM